MMRLCKLNLYGNEKRKGEQCYYRHGNPVPGAQQSPPGEADTAVVEGRVGRRKVWRGGGGRIAQSATLGSFIR